MKTQNLSSLAVRCDICVPPVSSAGTVRDSLCKRVVVDVVPWRSRLGEVGRGRQGRVGRVLGELERPQVGRRVLGLGVVRLLGEGLRPVPEQTVRTLQGSGGKLGLETIRRHSFKSVFLISVHFLYMCV